MSEKPKRNWLVDGLRVIAAVMATIGIFTNDTHALLVGVWFLLVVIHSQTRVIRIEVGQPERKGDA